MERGKFKMEKVIPFLMFQDGKAEEAMNFYTSLIEDSKITTIVRYGCNEGGDEGTIMKATFTLNKQIMYAYYDFEGKLIGVVHYMATSELPGSLQNEIKKKYARYWVTELFEVRNDEGTRFFVLLKNATGNLVLSADGTDTWYIFNVPNFKLSDL